MDAPWYQPDARALEVRMERLRRKQSLARTAQKRDRYGRQIQACKVRLLVVKLTQ